MAYEDFGVSLSETAISRHLRPHSPASLKANIKQNLALARDEISAPMTQIGGGLHISKPEARMRLLERVTHVSMPRITQCMVQKMELHASKSVNAAIRMEDMKYGAQL
ncbi:hypothetical protein PHYSODRAFT_335273 [Phytophthora sojae]|uniref:Uncharacterized protein n=1 Tax=Phytophthora sojae (strain P6497) TaxID=1094619 RepID=G4ZUP5_PHYSP|nr:hypothetical protein PHYSODRAFT_335273 [Phytophthora sojae]EGZ13519.1 hypothetical protein PHYSODRAFT_335273 [Phytophthora sojae]|eukprot:XP_009530948.1 hypothetical protein PHYSODRAFT_335273 [Phytophthora sojae]